MTDRYLEWRDFYAEKVRSWMSPEELRAECGKLTTTDGTSPELLLIHAMHALEEREKQRTVTYACPVCVQPVSETPSAAEG